MNRSQLILWFSAFPAKAYIFAHFTTCVHVWMILARTWAVLSRIERLLAIPTRAQWCGAFVVSVLGVCSCDPSSRASNFSTFPFLQEYRTDSRHVATAYAMASTCALLHRPAPQTSLAMTFFRTSKDRRRRTELPTRASAGQTWSRCILSSVPVSRSHPHVHPFSLITPHIRR